MILSITTQRTKKTQNPFIFFSLITFFLRVLEVKIFRTFTALSYGEPFYWSATFRSRVGHTGERSRKWPTTSEGRSGETEAVAWRWRKPEFWEREGASEEALSGGNGCRSGFSIPHSATPERKSSFSSPQSYSNTFWVEENQELGKTRLLPNGTGFSFRLAGPC